MIDLTARFTLDDAQARDWLAKLADPENCPPDLEAVACDLDLDEDWQTTDCAAERTAEQLIQAAMDAEIIGCPEETEIYFDYDDREDGGYYRFLVDIGADVGTMVRLATLGWEVRALGDPEARGAEAALSVLSEAVTSANGALDNLARLTTPQPAS